MGKLGRKRMIIVGAVSAAVLLMVLIGEHIYAMHILREQAYDANMRAIQMYMENVDQAFENMERYLVTVQQTEDMRRLMNHSPYESELEYYSIQMRIIDKMNQDFNYLNYADCLFVYSPDNEVLLYAPQSIAYETKNSITDLIIRETKSGRALDEKAAWFFSYAQGEGYLVRMIAMKNTYIGACIEIRRLMDDAKSMGMGALDYIAFYDDTYEVAGQTLPIALAPDEILEAASQIQIVSDASAKGAFMLLSMPSNCGNYGFLMLIPESDIYQGMEMIQKVISILTIYSLAVCIILGILVTRWYIRPLQKNVYEEQIRGQKLELQYMQLQMNPHFCINCINVIYNLSLMNKNELVRKMATYLGNHLRYTMRGNSVVHLQDELKYVDNYMKIQELRFENSIVCIYDITEAVDDILIPPLVIQTFVENTVKYEISPDECVKLYIKIRREEPVAHIQIWDTGRGYPETILTTLRSGKKVFDERGEHYGIYNVIQRLRLIYQGQASIDFSNHEQTGGACIDMRIPLKLPAEGEHDHEGIDC